MVTYSNSLYCHLLDGITITNPSKLHGGICSCGVLSSSTLYDLASDYCSVPAEALARQTSIITHADYG